ncbi:MAG: tetratricopeptide repeat protein [Nitrospinae bacterium]|nr:tetratricopeptide repeat protein [Nitrospinota bacterium]
MAEQNFAKEVDVKVLEERLNGFQAVLNAQKEAITDKTTDIEKQICIYINFFKFLCGSISFLLAIISFLGYQNLKSLIKEVIEKQTEHHMPNEQQIKELMQKKIDENVNAFTNELKKIKENEVEKQKEFTSYQTFLDKLKNKNIDGFKPIEKDTVSLLDRFKEKLEKTKKEGEYTLGDRFFKALAERENKKYTDAVDACTRAIELDPKDASAYNNRGNAYSDLKRYDEAIRDYGKAIELDPKYASAYNNRGSVYSNLTEYYKAIRDYDKAIELDPKYASVYNNRGNAYRLSKEYDKAIRDYGEAIKLNPKDTSAYSNRGDAYIDLKEYDKAIRDFDKAIELDPKDASARDYTSSAYRYLKEYDKAIQDFYKAIELHPEDAKPYNNLTEFYIIQNQYENALAIIPKTLKIAGERKDRAIALYLQCVALAALGRDVKEAGQKLEAALKEDFFSGWSFESLESWLASAPLSQDKKNYITQKNGQLKDHQKRQKKKDQ